MTWRVDRIGSGEPNWNVLLLEAGGDPPLESEVPLLFADLQLSEYDWKYKTEPWKECVKRLQITVVTIQGGKF
jgi:choline dehydrogenase